MSVIQNFCNSCDGQFTNHNDGRIRVTVLNQQRMEISLFQNASNVLLIRIIEESNLGDEIILEWASNQPKPSPLTIESNYTSKIVRFEGYQNGHLMRGQLCRCTGGLRYKLGYDDNGLFGDRDFDDIGADIEISNNY
jgi:hypothetical protein